MRPLTFACTSLAALALLSAPRSAPAATPEVITLSPGDTQATWQTPLIVGNTGEDPNNCIEDVSCDTVVIVLAAGDWTGKRVFFSIHWLSPASDWDLYILEGTVNGELVSKSDGFIPQNAESIEARHLNVEEDQRWAQRGDLPHRLPARQCLADDLEVVDDPHLHELLTGESHSPAADMPFDALDRFDDV